MTKRKNESMLLLLSHEEHERLKALAQQSHLTKSAYLLAKAFNNNIFNESEVEEFETLRKLAIDMTRLGSSLRELYIINHGIMSVDELKEITELYSKIRDTAERIKESIIVYAHRRGFNHDYKRVKSNLIKS